MSRNRLQATILALVLALGLAPARPALARSKEDHRPQALETACTSQESWQGGTIVPPFYAEKFEHAFDGKGSVPLFQLLLLADMLKNTSPAPQARYLAEYWVYRVLYDMKLTELSHSGFSSLLVRPPVPGAEVARQAALACLNRINAQYPSMIQTGLMTADKLTVLPPSPASYEAAMDLARAKLAIAGSQADVRFEEAYVRNAPAQTAFIKLLQAADQGSEPEVLRNTISLFRAYPYPEGFSVDPDAVYLMLGESFYGFRKYDRSLKAFERVRNTSNYFVQALIGKAWSQLMREEYAKAVSTAENLIVGGLKGVFAPEANVIVSISLNETCNFPEAVESINFYKKNYAKSNGWLRQWEGLNGRADLYTAATHYLKKQLRVPDRVASEWLRSAIFISGQDEINRIVDERVASAKIIRRINMAFDKKRELKWVPVRRELIGMLEGSSTQLERRMGDLKRDINADLGVRTQHMLENLNEVSANMQLVESEIYSNMGEKIITDYHRPNQDRGPAVAAAPADKKKKDSQGAVWDWGKYDVENDDHNEVWEDEVGFLRTDVTSKCAAR